MHLMSAVIPCFGDMFVGFGGYFHRLTSVLLSVIQQPIRNLCHHPIYYLKQSHRRTIMSISRRDLIKTIGALSVVNIATGCSEKKPTHLIRALSHLENHRRKLGSIGNGAALKRAATADGWLIGGTTPITAVILMTASLIMVAVVK